ncbi:N-acetylmuramoyl-L-alanine amidase [Pseudorhodoferax sp. LjRoot39]|uniref:N-acetylmuramoyl-L-alanine amidase n=1 Tax=Pseudorhodoferax sp. LjRoot39 TaxID=3342328 RepID=UPI003ECD257B
MHRYKRLLAMTHPITRSKCIVALLLMLAVGGATAKETTLGFDGVTELVSNPKIEGVTFSGATVLACGGALNCGQFPPASGSNILYDTSGGSGVITVTFDKTVKAVTKVSAKITGNRAITMAAFDVDGNLLKSMTTGGPNYIGAGTGISPNTLLSIALDPGSKKISKVTFRDSGNTFTIDDFSFTYDPATYIIDAGHGKLLDENNVRRYQRPATPTYNLREDNLTLLFAGIIRDKLKKDGLSYLETRTGENAPWNERCGKYDAKNDQIYYPQPDYKEGTNGCGSDLRNRMRIFDKLETKEKNGAVFISLHTNGGSGRLIKGRTQAYWCQKDSDKLSIKVRNAIQGVVPPLFTGNGLIEKNCDLIVLAATEEFNAPGTLAEILYHLDASLGNTDDEKILNDAGKRQQIGEAIAKALVEFSDEKNK